MRLNKLFLLPIIVLCNLQLHAQRITRGPYLQQPTADGITIRWRTEIPTSSKVKFWEENAAKSDSIINLNLTTEHIVILQNLQADKKIFYAIGTGEKILKTSDYQYFRTSPSSTTQTPITFWAMGDFGASDAPQYKSNQQAVRQQFLKHKNGRADLWVWLGDNAYCCGFQAEYQTQVFDFYGDEIFGNMTILPSPGNHEYHGNYPEFETLKKSRDIPYFDMYTMPTKGESGGVPTGVKAYYSANYGNIHFVSLDSYGYDDGQFLLADKRSK